MLNGLKQKDLENYLGIEREDQYNGSQLIDVYHKYLETGDIDLGKKLLLHNLDDVKGMIDLLSIRNFKQLSKGAFQITDIRMENDIDYQGYEKKYAVFEISWESPLPRNLSRILPQIQFHLHETAGIVRLPVFTGTLKYFYKDYKNYFYLPEEDTAVHKSIGQFVDRQHKIPGQPRKLLSEKNRRFHCCPDPGYIFLLPRLL